MLHRLLPLVVSACAISCLLIPGCQGAGDSPSTSLSPVLGQPGSADAQPETPFVLPSFPIGDLPDDTPRIVAAQDNIQTGAQAFARELTGTQISGTDLLLDSLVVDPAWALWRWGTFAGGNVPQELTVTVDPGTAEYWLLISDYKLKRWRVFGPLTDTTYTYNYVVGINHVSPSSHQTYVALVTSGGNGLTVNQLNLIANVDVVAPIAPTGLEVVSTTTTTAALAWTANTEPDLNGYCIYSGPAPDFDVNDSLADLLGEATAADTTFLVEDLEWEHEYHFRITAKDVSGNEGGPSNTASDSTLSPATEPTNLRTTGIGGTWVDLAWDLPEAGPPLGYEVYTGPATDFMVGDAGVIKMNDTLITTLTWRMSALVGETEYNVRVRAVFPSGFSPLSNSVKFTTINNSTPKPAFTVSPQYIMCNEDVLFNPAGTIDGDTPLEELLFKWDYENDGINDEQTTGPEIVNHVYTQRGPMTAKLTVSDGTEVSITEDFTVNYNFDYFMGKPSSSSPGSVIAVDTEPGGSRIAVLLTAGTNTYVEYYNGSTWSELDATALDNLFFADVALSPGGVSVLVAQMETETSYWTVYDRSGSTWTQTAKEAIAQDSGFARRFDIAPNGRMSVAVLEAYYTGTDPVVTHYLLYVWHEKADGTFSESNVTLENDNYEMLDVQRNDSSSYFMYGLNGSFHQWSFTDASNSNVVVQSYAGDLDHLTSGYDPDDSTHLYWAGATDGSRIYYGDNYGAANGTQFHAVTRVPSALLGVGLVSDNQSVFYWSDEDANAVQRVQEFDSVVGGGTESTIATAAGMADGGGGGYFVDGASAGVYTCADESRDGKITGRFMVGGSIEHAEDVYAPSGDDANILNRHVPLVFDDDSLLILSEQAFPTARAAVATAAGNPFSDTYYGAGTWCIPYAACLSETSGEFFVAGYRDMFVNPILELNRFTVGTSEGVLEDTVTGTSMPLLMHHPDAGGTLLCYASDSSTDVEIRSWNGATWSAPTSVLTGSSTIEALTLASRGTNEWAIALIDASENLKLVETSGGAWDAPQTISTDQLNGPSGVALTYHPDDSACLIVERNNVSTGLYVGIIPDGGSVSWTRIFSSNGNETRYPFATFQDDKPVCFFYLRKTPSRNSRIQIAEYIVNEWLITELPDQVHGSPVNYAVDSAGNIVIAGYNMSAIPRYSSVVIVYN